MVKMIPDNMGRFAQRPFYQEGELDNECERLIRDLLLKRKGKIAYPVVTDDLTVLIEMHDAELDSFADLSAYGPDVEGVTEFFPNRGPKVSISDRIAADDRRENRLRTTLTHEFGHRLEQAARVILPPVRASDDACADIHHQEPPFAAFGMKGRIQDRRRERRGIVLST